MEYPKLDEWARTMGNRPYVILSNYELSTNTLVLS
jgi:hypothetical protein